MCGIIGGINSQIPNKGILQHRGPDRYGNWLRIGSPDVLWMDHYRLSIIDLSDDAVQPMETNRYVMTFNGEIYNYKELASYLQPNDDSGNIKLPGDARTLINYFERFGVSQTLKDINGMYAIGLYDKIYNKLHLIVDRFAQKPLYYYHEGDTFAFASSPSALLHLKDKWKLSEQGLQSYWMLGSAMGSIWDGIEKVDGSEIVTYDLDKKTIVKERYWGPEFQENTSGIEDLILDAINKVKVSDVPVYLFLSGGIDSTLVASQCQGMNAIHLDGKERKYAEQAAERFNINLHVIDPKETDALEAIKDYSLKCAEPSMAGLVPYITAREASKFCKVSVSANGADEIFFGYDRTKQGLSKEQYEHIFRFKCLGGMVLPQYHELEDERFSEGRWLELQTYIKHDLNKTLDFASMAHSLEVRSPFLDHRLVEMALSIPKEKHGRKDILKRILKRFGFTDEFLNRPKCGFSLYKQPYGYELLQHNAYKWARLNGYLKLTGEPNPRDLVYLKASAAGFYGWYETFKDKL